METSQNVVYVDGEGGAETVVYEGAAPTGTQHVVRWQDGSKIFAYLVPPQAPAADRLDVPPINSTRLLPGSREKSLCRGSSKISLSFRPHATSTGAVELALPSISPPLLENLCSV